MSRLPPDPAAGHGPRAGAAPGEGPREDGSDPATPPRRRRRAEQTPLQRAIGLLSRREHSTRELTAKLEARGVEPDEARAAVERLGAEGWQDDARFAESILRTRAGAGYGPVRIRAELAMHGLDEAMVAAALSGYEGDWLENARDLVRRRVGPLPDRDLARRRKAADLLYRRGFESDHVRAALRPSDED